MSNTIPLIPRWLVNPMVFEDHNLGIVMVAGKTGEQWIYRVHGDHWCSVRPVSADDPMFILEKLNDEQTND